MKNKKFNLPYIGINRHVHDILYHEAGDHSVIVRITNTVLQYAADEEAYAAFHSIFSNIVKILGSGYTLQKLDIFALKKFKSRSSSDFLSQKYNEAFEGREYRDITTYLVITRDVKRSAFFTYDEKDFKAFQRNVTKVVDLLESKGFLPHVLIEKEIKSLISRMLAFNFSDEVYGLNNFSASEEGIRVGSKTIKSISLVDVDEINFPAAIAPYTDVKLGFPLPVDLLHFLNRVPGTDCVVYHQVIQIPDQRGELGRLTAKRKRHTSMPDPANDLAVEDIDRVMADIAKDNQLLVQGHYNILVSAREQHIDRAVNYIESALFSIGIIPSHNAHNQMELFRCALPGNASELKAYDKFQTTSDAALCLLFKEGLLKDEKSGFQIFFSDRQGIPVAIDTSDMPIDTNRMNNRNKFVLGPSGAGKSFFMNHLIRQYALQDTDVILVDTGHSYSGLCAYYGGKYITYSEEKPITMNPFRIAREEFNEEKREFLKSLVSLLWKGADGTVNQIEDSVLSSVVSAYYEDYYEKGKDSSYLSFHSFYDFSIEKIGAITKAEAIPFDITSYRFILKKFYRGGEYGTILNNEMDAALFDEKFIVFEIDAIKEHKILFPITTIIIMDVFLQKMRLKKNRKVLIIEEAWKAIASPLMAEYIQYVFKTVRKFWGEAIVVTQELDDIIGNPVVKDTIIGNSDTICLLDQTKFKDNFAAIASLLSLNEVEQKKIFTINNLDNKEGRGRFKEVYIKRGSTGEVYGVEVSLYEYFTFTTERREKEALQVYVDRYPTYRQALEVFVRDLRESGMKTIEFINLINTKSHEKIPVLD
ncbi:TraG family conjugative transposon ATPase [Pontibacter diazotrophicus]|uniref:TraG family conjugative transposon ATPase n=1 Tax=Pontibacter diazotrophicus TaxID=1400979 RepID=A0A3D8L3G5_9BACT|nr:TraG family conjugative transposon ATPase [Pontibacter diazotrophicus]RDV11886.1 TraG family conjugative transposon ATPase [Pontibacter diazotrophicus]